MRVGLRHALAALIAIGMISVSLWILMSQGSGVRIEQVSVGTTPATIFTPTPEPDLPGPIVVIAHGFAGSQQLMQPFAISLARNGYTAITFDFLGHGRNPRPMAGDVTTEDGATRFLLEELGRVVQFARERFGQAQIALLGHSMASDIIVRQAVADPEIQATVAVSMFSRVITPDAPKNLLVIVGDWEPQILKDEGLRVVEQISGSKPDDGVSYGSFADGTARRTFFSPSVEHIGVLYQTDGIREAITWLDQAFDRESAEIAVARGPWILLMVAGCVLLAWPASRLLPCLTDANAPPRPVLSWRRLLIVSVAPALLTPLILWPLPTDFLPVLVGGYLVCHFGLYGLLTALALFWVDNRPERLDFRVTLAPKFIASTGAVTIFGLLALGAPIESFVASFVPIPERWYLLALMMVGTVTFFLSQAWVSGEAPGGVTRGIVLRSFFISSLALAIGLDLEGLFFLIILMPVILLFFAIYGLFAHWVTRRTGHPLVAAIANGIALAWAIAVTFPLLAG
jgi:pimeloyl-ACP methyl ester carboxylesterase